jgi:hypothetical protein
MSDIGLASYQKAKKYKTISVVFRFASLITSFEMVAAASKNDNNNLLYGLLGGQFAFIFASMQYGKLSAQNLDRALWQRNKDLLFPK